jgi:hypothetical protein
VVRLAWLPDNNGMIGAKAILSGAALTGIPDQRIRCGPGAGATAVIEAHRCWSADDLARWPQSHSAVATCQFLPSRHILTHF